MAPYGVYEAAQEAQSPQCAAGTLQSSASGHFWVCLLHEVAFAIVRTLRIIPLEVGNLMCQCMFTAKDSGNLMQDRTLCSGCRIPRKTFHKNEKLLLDKSCIVALPAVQCCMGLATPWAAGSIPAHLCRCQRHC